MTPRVQVRKAPRSPLGAQIITALRYGPQDGMGIQCLMWLTDPLVYRLAQRADPVRHMRAVMRTLEKRGDVVSAGNDRWKLP